MTSRAAPQPDPAASTADPVVGRHRPGAAPAAAPPVAEIGGRRNGLEPTRYGDWEKDGRCIDF